MTRAFVVGTRGSALALWQANHVISLLRARAPSFEIRFEIKTIRTAGDRLREVPFSEIGAHGVFVDEVRRALLDGEVDLAVHSVKDLPSEPAKGLALAVVGPREDPRDALVTRHRTTLDRLPVGARIGTGSPRRAALLRAARPDLEIVGIRGNVDTRVRKGLSGDLDGVVLAAAGLRRLGLEDQISEVLSVALMTPSPGQGALGVEVRSDDAGSLDLLAAVDDPATHRAVDAEQSVARSLGAGCRTPLGAYASVDGTRLRLMGVVARPDGRRVLRDEIAGESRDAEALGAELARRLGVLGAGAIVQETAGGHVSDGE